MSSFMIGEEVKYEGERFVISQASERLPLRYRLLSTTPEGARMIWASPDELQKMSRYTTPVDDTNR
ncbi:MAG: hypothetical protein KF813_10180 [Trueperaceae bacterium]|nr:hypothetical protein [Trueperaceae bacterium]